MTLMRILVFCLVAYVVWRLLKPLLQSHVRSRPRGPTPGPEAKIPSDVLGVPSTASQDEIRAAYRRLIMQYHPDRVSGMGPEIIAMAEKRTKEINEAYAELKR